MLTSEDRRLFISALHLLPGQFGKNVTICSASTISLNLHFGFDFHKGSTASHKMASRSNSRAPLRSGPVLSGRSGPVVRSITSISSWKTRLQSGNKIREATKQDVCSFVHVHNTCLTQYSSAVVFYRMGKRYHCEYCNRSFADTPHTRKNHINGVQHKRNRKLHYDSFKGTRAYLYI